MPVAPNRDPFQMLRTYRQRYGSDMPSEADRLEARLGQRQARAHALRRRVRELGDMLEEAERDLEAVLAEIEGTKVAAGLLADEIVDDLRVNRGEVWSPNPVLGYRVWLAREMALVGAKTVWPKPELRAICLNRVRGDDLPHSHLDCGPPPCGIYSTKELTVLRSELGLAKSAGYVFGLVAMTGKVVEHEHGYRAAHAEVVAAAANYAGHHLLTNDRIAIAELFAEPRKTMMRRGFPARISEHQIDQYLADQHERHTEWTWEKS